jgi:hypothetical protein
MATLEDRLSEFTTDAFPNDEISVELLCRDNRGTYTLPYPCCRFDQEWRNFKSDETVTADVIGWRPFVKRKKLKQRS